MGGFTTDSARLLARGYLRLLATDTRKDQCGYAEESQFITPERLDFPFGIAMTCAGQDDDNPLAREEL